MGDQLSFEQAQYAGLISADIQKVMLTGGPNIIHACTACGSFVNWPVEHTAHCPAKLEEHAKQRLLRDYSDVYPELKALIEPRTTTPPMGSY